ncbi:MAG: response regulator [Proteobacteria bacterium]|nr:response regulator [Pseudomonadota bacterium]
MTDNIPRAESVLLVDDEAGIRTVLGITLEDKGYRVFTAASGQEALEQFEAHPPPIVLTDIKMPGMDGIALLREIKDRRPETEVIMVTGHGDLDLAVKSMQFGAADFISKPVSDDALTVALHRAEERIHLRDRIREYTEDLERLVEERTEELLAAERMAAVGRTVTDLSHTIKNIASGLEGGIYVLGKGIELDKKKYLTQGWELVRGNVGKIKNLSLDLLNYAKYAQVELVPCDPAEPALEAAEIIRPRVEQLGASFTLDLADDLDGLKPRCLLDHDAMVRLLLNLLDNGLDACQETAAKELRLTACVQGGELIYQVEDSGSGFDATARDRAFTSFFTTKGSSGTGIGLMTCRKIAEEHGGSVDLSPGTVAGSVVTVRLPLLTS